MSRQETLEAVRRQPEVSVLVVGAGVNGIGVFRELALQGVDVLLVDKGDFCSGTSAASSHMIHGGLKYLENGEFRLVREALTERNRLLHNAPHYVRPLPTTIPIFSWLSGMFNAPLKFLNLLDRPGERGAVVIKIGLSLYDFFTRSQQTLPAHSFMSRAKSLQTYPDLNPAILCTATYYDAWTLSPERICVELILDAEAVLPHAHALNYVSLHHAAGDSVQLKDELTGEILTVKPGVVVNAAGPWIDFVNLQMKQTTKFIAGTKGSHLVLDCPELRRAIGEHEFYFENKDGRICLILPFGDRVMVGSTDIHFDDPDQVRCTEDEIDYMFSSVKIVFPEINLDRSKIVFRFSGVRPLPPSSAALAGQITRDHSIQTVEPGSGIDFPVLSLVGGKWTTFRAFSEQVTDAVLKRLNRSRAVHTHEMPIGGGRGFPLVEAEQNKWVSDLQQKTGLPPARARALFERYGTRAEEFARFIQNEADAPLAYHPEYTRREIMYLALREKVVHIDDLILRRSAIGMLGQTTPALLAELAGIIGSALGWSEETVKQEIEHAAHILHDRHGIAMENVPAVQRRRSPAGAHQ